MSALCGFVQNIFGKWLTGGRKLPRFEANRRQSFGNSHSHLVTASEIKAELREGRHLLESNLGYNNDPSSVRDSPCDKSNWLNTSTLQLRCSGKRETNLTRCSFR